jgi:hypothetical protein
MFQLCRNCRVNPFWHCVPSLYQMHLTVCYVYTRHGVERICSLLWCYAAYSTNFLPDVSGRSVLTLWKESSDLIHLAVKASVHEGADFKVWPLLSVICCACFGVSAPRIGSVLQRFGEHTAYIFRVTESGSERRWNSHLSVGSSKSVDTGEIQTSIVKNASVTITKDSVIILDNVRLGPKFFVDFLRNGTLSVLLCSQNGLLCVCFGR